MTKTIQYRFLLTLYGMLWYAILPGLLLIFLARLALRKSGYNSTRLSRFSIFSASLKPSNIVWHCVSVGEVVAVVPLIKKLLARHPHLTITITTTTATGAAQVKHHFQGEWEARVQHMYLPYDCGWFMRRLISRIQPELVIVTEVEIWPNLINVSTARHVPTAIVNARMTTRSADGYAKLGRFFSETVRQFAFISCQSKADKMEYLRLGARPDGVVISGNVKFELTPVQPNELLQQQLDAWTQQTDGIIVAAGSTHEPEETLLLDAVDTLTEPPALLCIAPRHPERFDPVESLLKSRGIAYTRLSTGQPVNAQTRVLLIDAIGQLHTVYRCADIAFVGGSFAPRGGHNALEPALYSTPVVMGPSQYNNPQMYQQLSEAGNLVTVDNLTSLQKQLQAWAANPQRREAAGNAGSQVISQNRGALNANAALISTLL
ncbi:3-deoxy-D-manno-octulosonic acid transferase [Alteromonas oceanisediminis]|uniref:3-deoxy-D-manno-octulosonic acid transferase n=1 Tax=Alteromonas oceanisediminis TaxID=2836180 RepID=UPI001BD9ACAE|nr:3-deoxy-D-manno-octulosonic acid transferase [Alteromonas oceanisediminis]MBT0586756.1 3-deoxy-D-manno-octulosonic acid transferase [Alteromonas oceanisediminis]